MVTSQLVARGIGNARVLGAMLSVPREQFVADELRTCAYYDTPLPIEEGQSISQPYIVALMVESLELRPTDRVLEIGSGSGYAAAILGCIAKEVHTIERIPKLAGLAEERCRALGYLNVHVHCADGSLGWPPNAPYDAIAVAAGAPAVPPALLEQLALGGRMVIPVGPAPRGQQLLRIRRGKDGALHEENLGAVRFVPLTGTGGWPGERQPGGGIKRPAGTV